ncbi:MAG: hypothetical protein ABEN55_13095, partial [Bradymonadaceae bacterium]
MTAGSAGAAGGGAGGADDQFGGQDAGMEPAAQSAPAAQSDPGGGGFESFEDQGQDQFDAGGGAQSGGGFDAGGGAQSGGGGMGPSPDSGGDSCGGISSTG